jgi:flagellar hook-associated protein 1 FlgK
MTISGSLSSALSGLTAVARAAELVSSNVANAMTEGYGRRELELSPRVLGGVGAGVSVAGVVRDADEILIADRRLAEAAMGHDKTAADFLARLETEIGTPEDGNSLSGLLARFESSLIEAASRPESEARLAAVLNAARALATKMHNASQAVQNARMRADHDIALQVDTLNEGLARVQDLNWKIKSAHTRGLDAMSLIDLRQKTIDELSTIVPMRMIERDNDQVALFTTGGAILLEGKAVKIGFDPVGVIVPEMSQKSGALSGLSIAGVEIRTGGARSPISGGSLAGLFAVRDDLAVDAQTRLDAVARDLVERFQNPALDATRPAGGPGLFTDGGAVFDTADETALSTRIAVNAAADPAQGGALWRLRDGLGAASPGEVGDASLLGDLRSALTAGRIAASGGFGAAARSASGLAGEFLSGVSSRLRDADAALGYASARYEMLKEMELGEGVNTDHEMQKLMLIEQAYAANAQVMSAADEMLRVIMGI